MLSRQCVALLLLATATPALHAQAVLGPTEDATVAPVGAARFRFANAWQHYDFSAGNATYEAQNYTQLRFSTLSMEVGLRKGLSATFVVPEAGNLVTTSWYSHQGSYLRLDSVMNSSYNGIGDLELGAKFAWLAGPGELERIALPPGLHVRSAVSASYRFATGRAPAPADEFGVATGSGRPAFSAASQTDLMFGHAFWISVVGRYVWPQTVTRDVLVLADSDAFAPLGVVSATQSQGNVWTLEATPRVVLGRYFSLGAQYLYLHRSASAFVGTRDTVIAGDPVTLDASSLDSLTSGTAQYLSGSLTYSTVAAYLQRKAGFPIEISYQYSATLSATGAMPKQAATNTVTFRVWARLWGAGFKQAAPPAPAGAGR